MQKKVTENITAEEIIQWKIDSHHHKSLITYPSEKIVDAELAKKQAKHEKINIDYNITMVEKFMGLIITKLADP